MYNFGANFVHIDMRCYDLIAFCDVISSIVLRVALFADTLSCPQKNRMEFAPSFPLPKGEKICRHCGWLFDEVMGACAWSKFTAPKVV